LYKPSSKENKDAYLKIEKLLRETPNEAYEIAVINESLPLIKLALVRGADPNIKIKLKYPLVSLVFNDEIFNFLVDKSVDSQDNALIITKNFLELFDLPYMDETKCILTIKLYDKLLPEVSKYIKAKSFWKTVLMKLKKFKSDCPNLVDTYNKWIDFYVNLAKDD
jgi:hypothetical protein